MVVVTAASLSDQVGARHRCKRRRGPGKPWRTGWVEGTDRGAAGPSWVKAQDQSVLASVVRAAGQQGCAGLPQRWGVESPLAW